MDEKRAAETLAALGNPKRLQVFRLLVRAGREGMNVGEIMARLGLPASTLAHHIAALVKTGLVEQDKRGREVICIAKYEAMEAVFSFVIDQCCVGVQPLGRVG